MSIPKVIHYCWLSGEKMPAETVKCIDSWKKHMPEYALVLWDANKFDINSHQFVKEACQAKKWASASDYIRLYALYTEGGIYLDTDVYVKKSFNRFLENGFFTSVEYHKDFVKKWVHLLNDDGTLKNNEDIFTHGIQLQAAIMGSVKGHPFLKSCMDWYDDKHFIWDDGTTYCDKFVSPHIYAHIAVKYGFRYKNELQKLNHDMTIYQNCIFPGGLSHITEESYAVHICRGEWRGFWPRLTLNLTRNNFVRTLLGKRKLEKIF
jgi:hypothetical protein